MNNTLKPFIVPVNEAGLPHGWCPLNSDDEANVIGLKAQEIAHLYWMLKKLEISYAYKVNGKIIERNFSIHPPETPRERIQSPPKFYESNAGSATDYWIGFDASKVFQSSQKGKFDIYFDIYEENSYQNFILTTNFINGYRKISEKKFTFGNRELTLNLWLEFSDWTGSIEYVKLKENFY